MTTAKKELYETIELFPDAIVNEVLNYADFLAARYFQKEMPDRVVIKNGEDLKRKLKERIKKLDSGEAKIYTIDEAFEEINKI